MELNDKRIESDELDEESLENTWGGLHNRELVQQFANKNQELYRKNMLDRLNEEGKDLEEEHTKSR